MKDIPIKLGPLALLLTVISICLTTLSILTFTTAGADERLAARFADTVSERYMLEAEGQKFMAELQKAVRMSGPEAAAPYGTDTDLCRHVLSLGDTTLTIEFTVSGTDVSTKSWRMVRNWEEDKDLNFWDGK